MKTIELTEDEARAVQDALTGEVGDLVSAGAGQEWSTYSSLPFDLHAAQRVRYQLLVGLLTRKVFGS